MAKEQGMGWYRDRLVPRSATDIVLALRRYAFLRLPQILGQEFLEWLPIVSFPSRSQDFCLAVRKARMVKYDLGAGAMFHELELRN